MSEVLVLFLVIVQIVVICCCVAGCVFIIKSYCGLPCSIARRAFREFFKEPDVENQQRPMTEVVGSQAQRPSIPAVYSPNPKPHYQPYPVYQIPQIVNLPYPVMPSSMPSYPHEIGFVGTSPSPHTPTSNLKDDQQKPSEKNQKF